jgi:hypothetical protein
LTKGQRLKVPVEGALVYAEVIEVIKLTTEPVRWKLLARELESPARRNHRGFLQANIRILTLLRGRDHPIANPVHCIRAKAIAWPRGRQGRPLRSIFTQRHDGLARRQIAERQPATFTAGVLEIERVSNFGIEKAS